MISSISLTAFLALAHTPQLSAFSPSISSHITTVHPSFQSHLSPRTSALFSSYSDDEEENPYYDPNFPNLEYVNYSDPNYSAFQGDDDDDEYAPSSPLLSEEETLAEIEAMRESRRRRNDEFQFETYHSSVLRGGSIAMGEWTVFQTDTFMNDVSPRKEATEHIPRLLKWDKVLKVVSRGYKIIIDENAEWRVDGERIVHEEKLAEMDNFPIYDLDDSITKDLLNWEEEDRLHVESRFWPKEMESGDFRGAAGNMCVGKAYTICDAVPLSGGEGESHDGPFREMRTELGVADGGMRFRVKLDYATLGKEEGSSSLPPPLHLRTLTVCRETLDGYWPNPSDNGPEEEDAAISDEMTARRKNQGAIDAALFGPPGAPGGLYDPPPVGSEERATRNYMLLDFEGGATLLLPHKLDQHDEEHGWVTSLDWTPGKIRYQVDRKVLSGRGLKGLKTLELSEVVGEDAERWRPKDGGADMRQ